MGLRQPGESAKTQEWHEALGISTEEVKASEEQVRIALSEYAKLLLQREVGRDFAYIYLESRVKRLVKQAIAPFLEQRTEQESQE